MKPRTQIAQIVKISMTYEKEVPFVAIDADVFESMLDALLSYCAVCEYEWGIIWCLNACLEYWGETE